MKLAVVDNSINKVINIVTVPDGWTGAPAEYDKKGNLIKPAEWQVPDGYTVMESPVARIGDEYVNGEFITPSKSVDLQTCKDEAIEANRAEAERRIGILFGKSPGVQLAYAELNTAMQALELNKRYTESQTGGIALTPDEQAAISNLETLGQKITAIRAAENDTAGLINDAATVDDVKAVTVNWPT